VRLITALIQEHDLTKFFTLTLDRVLLEQSSDQPWEYIHHPWSKMRKRMNRKFAAFNFVAILEGHKNDNYPHIHGFTNVWMDQKSWSSMWDACGGGRIVWIEQVKNEGLSEYVSKSIEVARYVGKEQLREGYKNKKGHRTLWRSKGLKANFELKKEPGWCIIKENVFNEEGEVRKFWQRKDIIDGSKG